MVLDPEIEVMNEICVALKTLDNQARQRVLNWIFKRFSSDLQIQTILESRKTTDKDSRSELEIASFQSVSDIFAKARPGKGVDRVLIVASYLQESKGGKELTAREISMQLNLLGHRVRNITATIGSLMHRKPQLMIQTRKEGKTKQAQKRYKVTAEGLAHAKRMLN